MPLSFMLPVKCCTVFALFVLLAMGATDASAANLVTNPGFEGGVGGWTTWGSAISASAEQRRSGVSSCLNTGRTADWQGCVQDLNGKLTVGKGYRISAWLRLRNVAGERGQLTLQRTDAAGVSYFGTDAPLVSNDAWTPVVLHYTHAGTAVTGVNLFITTPGSTNEFFADDVTVETVYDPQAVAVDLSQTRGAVTQCGSGFLFGLSAADPAAAFYEPLKPKLQRDRSALLGNAVWGAGTGFGSPAFMSRVRQAGARHQVLVSDDYCWDRNCHGTWGWPGDAAHDGYGPYDLLDQTIDQLTASAQANGYEVEWDIWNEPDHPTFWGRDRPQFFAAWKHAYQRIRANDPAAVIVGPSMTGYGTNLTEFLLYAQANSVLPDVVSWHQLGSRKSVNAEVQAVRAFMAANGMPARPVDINEYIGDAEWSNPGIHAWYLAGLERAGVRRAAHAVWDEVPGDPSSGGIFAGRLAHLLTRDTHQPRAVWHVYKAYADLAGTMVRVSPSIQTDGLAATDADGTVRLILGNDSGDTNSVNLTISRLDVLPYYTNGAVRLTVRRIPNAGTAALAAPMTVTNTLAALSGNTLTVPLSFGPAEVLLITVATPTLFLAEDFEHEWADNDPAVTANGWTATGGGDASSITNPAVGYAPLPGGVPFPMSYDHAAARKVLRLDTRDAMLATPPADAAFTNAKVYADMMVNLDVCKTLPAAVSNDANLKTAVLLMADGAATNLYVFHGRKIAGGFGEPVFTAVTSTVPAGTWCRLTLVFDAASGAGGDAEAFRVLLNGKPLLSPAAYCDDWKVALFQGEGAPGGGTWFLSAARRAGSAGLNPGSLGWLGLKGTGLIDDLVLTGVEPKWVQYFNGTLIKVN